MNALPVDARLLCQVRTLVEAVSTDRADGQVVSIAAYAREQPDRVAEVVAVLAAAYGACVPLADLADLIEQLGRTRLDLLPLAREAHAQYEGHRLRGETHLVPGWVLAGERAYSRITKAARRARVRREPRLRAQAG